MVLAAVAVIVGSGFVSGLPIYAQAMTGAAPAGQPVDQSLEQPPVRHRVSLPEAAVSPAPAAPLDHAAGATDEPRRLSELVMEAWQDAFATWDVLVGEGAWTAVPPHLNFVSNVQSGHCYGLYVSAGPVYCSGNHTIFVSVAELQRIARQLPDVGDAGLALLVGHELGHHVQKLHGRFRAVSELMRTNPAVMRELTVRFELEADCLAGVWMAHSPRYAGSEDRKRAMLAALDAIGDDNIMLASAGRLSAEALTHGTSVQRRRWFETGLQSGRIEACAVLEAPDY